HLLLLSDESRMVVEYDQQGVPVSMLGLRRGSHGLARSIPQAEGLAIDSQRRVYIASEPNLFYRFVPEGSSQDCTCCCSSCSSCASSVSLNTCTPWRRRAAAATPSPGTRVPLKLPS